LEAADTILVPKRVNVAAVSFPVSPGKVSMTWRRQEPVEVSPQWRTLMKDQLENEVPSSFSRGSTILFIPEGEVSTNFRSPR
jgi:hypothetical protein